MGKAHSPKVYAYLRVSTGKQDIDAQRMAVMEYAVKEGYKLEFVEDAVSSRKAWGDRKVGEVIRQLKAGDILIASDATRLARSAYELLQMQEKILEADAELHIVNENLIFKVDTGQSEIDAVMKELTLVLLGQMGKLQRAFISKKTKEGLEAAREKGKKLGRPSRESETLKLDKLEPQIKRWLKMGLPLSNVAKLCAAELGGTCSRDTLYRFLRRRKLSFGKPGRESKTA